VRLFGLYPEDFRVVSDRSMFDQKPYGLSTSRSARSSPSFPPALLLIVQPD
jgi:hypothetical protein